MGQPFKLRSWQKKVIEGIYGSPTRRAIISFGRKNGKTCFAAVLLLLHLCGIDHKRLNMKFQGLDVRLTGIAGELVKGIVG